MAALEPIQLNVEALVSWRFVGDMGDHPMLFRAKGESAGAAVTGWGMKLPSGHYIVAWDNHPDLPQMYHEHRELDVVDYWCGERPVAQPENRR